MACLLTTGFPYSCNDGVGGIKPGTLLITQYENITQPVTVVAGEITVMTQAGGTSFFRYELDRETVNFDTTNTNTPATGINFLESTVVAFMKTMSATKNVELKLLTQKACVIICQDNNDVFHAFGVETGIWFSIASSSGKAFGDANGYTMTGLDQSKNRYTVATSLMATILIDGENS